jgi:hypothetical protein
MLAPKCACAAGWSNTNRASPVTWLRSNVSCMSRNTSTSFGSGFAVTNEPNTMNRFRPPVATANSYTRFRRIPTSLRGIVASPNWLKTSCNEAGSTPCGRSPVSAMGGKGTDDGDLERQCPRLYRCPPLTARYGFEPSSDRAQRVHCSPRLAVCVRSLRGRTDKALTRHLEPTRRFETTH